MWHIKTWSSGGLGSAELMDGLDDLQVFFCLSDSWFYNADSLHNAVIKFLRMSDFDVSKM